LISCQTSKLRIRSINRGKSLNDEAQTSQKRCQHGTLPRFIERIPDARVGGVNHTTNVICNPLYTVYFTTANKDRLTVLKGLQPGRELKLTGCNPLTFSLIQDFKIPAKWQKALKLLPQETVLSEVQFNHLLNNNLPKLGAQQLTRIREAAAIAFYQKMLPVQLLHCF
jgi:hypothetical protein